MIYIFAIILPSTAVCIRRLHDIGKRGWMVFISLIPVIGSIWLLILACKEGNIGSNEYGMAPEEYGMAPEEYGMAPEE